MRRGLGADRVFRFAGVREPLGSWGEVRLARHLSFGGESGSAGMSVLAEGAKQILKYLLDYLHGAMNTQVVA